MTDRELIAQAEALSSVIDSVENCPILYSDTIRSRRVNRDDLWAITTEQLLYLRQLVRLFRAFAEQPAEQGEPVPGDRMPDGFGSEPARDAENLAFELWYATHAFDYERHPIGSRECALQRAAWIARSTRGTAPPADERVAALEAQVAGNAKLIARLTETAAEAEAELAKVRVELANWKSGGSQGTIAKWRQDSQELARVKAENEQWKNTVRDIGHTVNCLYSTFPDANKHIVSAIQVVKAERDAAVADAERLRAAFRNVVRHDIAFSWDGEKQCHVPWIMVEFAEVKSGEPNTAQGWRDRDTFAAAIDAARKEGV